MKFDHAPGLTIRTRHAFVESQDGTEIRLGTMVTVTGGMFKGMVGHITELVDVLPEFKDIGTVEVRQGTPAEWTQWDGQWNEA